MIAWLVGITTAILLFFVLWRRFSRSFRDRCEEPKHLFLKDLDTLTRPGGMPIQTHFPKEKPHEQNHS